ncbi:MAG: 2-oxoglutarate dehydrogenase complex dihydrolipoyllysine-residue succinyltransferase [Anaerolineaceae bacterium]|nr:2-oxoglutarate dehydrogenase complex dihydrolipoyllysine-residue succinyltransferase [Anaerolineaceae bacterium]
MLTKIVVPSLGESIVEATVAHWYKQVGDRVASGEKLVELETDKVNLDVGAEHNGVLAKVEHPEGDDVNVGEVLGIIDEIPDSSHSAETVTNQEHLSPTEVVRSNPEKAPSPPGNGEKERVTPVARRMAQDMGIDPGKLTAARPGGRVTKLDVQHIAVQQSIPKTSEFVSEVGKNEPVAQLQPVSAIFPQTSQDLEERMPLSRRRRTIAQRLVEAQHTAAMLTTFNDVDVSAISQIRANHKEAFRQKYTVSLGWVSFFIKATVSALKAFPRVNAELRGDDLILKHYYDIGVAVGSEEGLVVPVLRGADRMSFRDIEQTIHEYVNKTAEGKLTVEDLRGGTFTITNGGVFGSLLSTPIVNTPQVGILGLHRIEERPVVVNSQVTIRPMMYLALSYDHRVIDGREAVLFLKHIKVLIESPERLLLEL